jgi:hypothetical protein
MLGEKAKRYEDKEVAVFPFTHLVVSLFSLLSSACSL